VDFLARPISLLCSFLADMASLLNSCDMVQSGPGRDVHKPCDAGDKRVCNSSPPCAAIGGGPGPVPRERRIIGRSLNLPCHVDPGTNDTGSQSHHSPALSVTLSSGNEPLHDYHGMYIAHSARCRVCLASAAENGNSIPISMTARSRGPADRETDIKSHASLSLGHGE
jgi:hypothetical protein